MWQVLQCILCCIVLLLAYLPLSITVHSTVFSIITIQNIVPKLFFNVSFQNIIPKYLPLSQTFVSTVAKSTTLQSVAFYSSTFKISFSLKQLYEAKPDQAPFRCVFICHHYKYLYEISLQSIFPKYLSKKAFSLKQQTGFISLCQCFPSTPSKMHVLLLGISTLHIYEENLQ